MLRRWRDSMRGHLGFKLQELKISVDEITDAIRGLDAFLEVITSVRIS
jgi:hypothetical protein